MAQVTLEIADDTPAPPEAAPAAEERGVLVEYPKSAIARRLLPPGKAPSPLQDRLNRIAGTVLPTAIMLTVLLVVWQLACGHDGSALPGPLKVWQESRDVILHPLKGVSLDSAGLHIEEQGDVGIAGHILRSLGRVLIGYGLSAVAGVMLGMLIGTNAYAYRALDPLFQVLRTVPPLAWLPISLAIFQDVRPSAIFLIFITAIWPIILNTAAGVQNIPPSYRNVARVLALNPAEYFFRIVLPACVPHIFTGLRIGVGMSWLAIIATPIDRKSTRLNSSH